MDILINNSLYSNISQINIYNTSNQAIGFAQSWENDIIQKTLSGTYSTSVSYIGDYAFAYCNQLQSIYITTSYVGSFAFCSCTNLQCAEIFLTGLNGVYEYAFSGCLSLESVNIHSSPNYSGSTRWTIRSWAFSYCASLKCITFDYAISPTYSAFAACYSLSSVLIKCNGSDTDIIMGRDAFLSCRTLMNIFIMGYLVWRGDGWGSSGISSPFFTTPLSRTIGYLGHYGSLCIPQSMYSIYMSRTYYQGMLSERIVQLTSSDIANIYALWDKTPDSITVTVNQGNNIIYDTDDLSTIRKYLTAVAHFSSGDIAIPYVMLKISGTLSIGSSTLTASYAGVSATFSVTVTDMWENNVYNVPLYKLNQCGIRAATDYNSTSSTRVSYTEYDIRLDTGYKYTFTYTTTASDTVYIGVQYLTSTGFTDAKNGTSLTSTTKKDMGWQTSGYTLPSQSNIKRCWMTFGCGSSKNKSLTPSQITSITITRTAV